MRPTRSASFSDFVIFSCTDRNYANNASKRLRFGDIKKYMSSKHSAKFGVSTLKNGVTGHFFIMGKYLCRTLYDVHLLYIKNKTILTSVTSGGSIVYLRSNLTSGGSSIEADKALPHPKSPRSDTLQYFYLQYSKMRCIVKENNIL